MQTPDAQSAAANDGPGGAASWTTGNKLAVGTSAGLNNKVWFTVAKGITSEVFFPSVDVPNMEDMQYVVTDGSTFVDLEHDATCHAISMPTEKALEYAVMNTDKRPSPKYRVTNTYVADPSRDSLLIRTRFGVSLDGGVYRLYLLANPDAEAGANNKAWWDGTNSALMASGTRVGFVRALGLAEVGLAGCAPPGGGSPGSFPGLHRQASRGRKLFIDAQALSKLPSTEKCSALRSPFTSGRPRSEDRNSCAISWVSRRSRFFEKVEASNTLSSIAKPDEPAEQHVELQPFDQLPAPERIK